MGKFCATVQNFKGSDSGIGKKNSGLSVMGDAWKVGVTLSLYHDKRLNLDVIRVYANGGSSGVYDSQFLIGYLVEGKGKTLYANLSTLR